jgi:diguanylate cyclase (GGDEF)-like protein/PAS domain S-box-containing protein
LSGRVAAAERYLPARLLTTALARARRWGRSLPWPADQARFWESLVEATGDLGQGLVVLDRGRPVKVNAAWGALTGYAPDETLAMASLASLLPLEEREAGMARLTATSGDAGGRRFLLRVVAKDGHPLSLEIATRTVRLRRKPRVVLLVRDMTAGRRSDELRAMQIATTRILNTTPTFEAGAPRILETVARSLGLWGGEAWLLDRDRGVLVRRGAWWAPAAEMDELHRERQDLEVGLGTGLPGRVWAAVAPVIIPDLAADPGLRDVPMARGLVAAAGFPILVDDAVVGVIDLFGPGAAGLRAASVEVMLDLGRQLGHVLERRRTETALRESMARLAEVAATDPLTGLRNRREFDRLLATIPRQRFAICTIDVDGLKHVNDEYGHEAGDAMLRGVGQTLTSSLRGWDVVARVGGDEFVALMVGIGPDETAAAAERMRSAVHAISVPHGQARVSVGWAVGEPGADPRGVARLADSHLYQAKEAGRDRVCGGSINLAPGLSRRSEWAARVDRAIRLSELRIVYQPICRLDDGAVIGHEALARPPGMRAGESVEDLFAEAQRSGRMRDLDWLCRRLAIAGAPWDLLPRWTLFLNVSALTLLDPVHPPDQLLLILEAAGGRPEQLVLEITEREIITDLPRVRQVLAGYRNHGVRFALDDVGDGHSTLELLTAANPEFIKIARSLTMTASHAGSRAAIKALVSFARASGAAIIAEGIENELAARQTRDLGAELGQGWWLARPTEAGVLEVTGTRSVGLSGPELRAG